MTELDSSPTTEPSSCAEERTIPLGDAVDEAPDDRIGRYVVLGEIGRGSMGVVYRALDPDLGREVAIKLFRRRHDVKDAELRARLVREAQTLARLSHPNVVTVYDVSVHEARGRVFLAMEYVQGHTLRQWLERECPSWQRIVDVFVAVGEGLGAAHAAGLVHRDVKPHNILMGEDGRPRLTDFGLARGDLASVDSSTGFESATSTNDDLTQLGAIMGTPAYMSPEQHRTREVDARTDQYAFCVTLYEALAGSRPFEGRTAHALLHAKLEGAPPRLRGIPPKLGRTVERGLHPDPAQRWESMPALVEALRSVLRPRRLWPWGIATAAVVTIGMVVSGTGDSDARCTPGGSGEDHAWSPTGKALVRTQILATELPYADHTWTRVESAIDAWVDAWQRERTEACEATHLRKELAERDMDRRIACLGRQWRELEATASVLASADDSVVSSAVRLVSELPSPERCRMASDGAPGSVATFDPAVAKLESELARAKALQRAGKPGEASKLAATVLEDARELDKAELAAEALALVGRLHRQRGEYEEAERVLTSAFFELSTARRDAAAAAVASELTALLGHDQARTTEALRWAEHARALVERADGEDLAQRLANDFGVLLLSLGRYDEAAVELERGLAAAEARDGADALGAAPLLTNLGLVAKAQGRLQDAKGYHERALAIRRSELGAQHPDVAGSLVNLGVVMERLGDPAVARTHYEVALEIFDRSYGPSHPHVATVHLNLGVLAYDEERYEEAVEAYRRALEIRERIYDEDHPNVIACLNNIGNALTRLERWEEAEQYHQRALISRQKVLGTRHRDVAGSLSNLASAIWPQGRTAEAVDLYRQAIDILEEVSASDGYTIGLVLRSLAEAQAELGEIDDAIATLERAETLLESSEAAIVSLAEVRFLLASISWDHEVDRKRALDLARTARDMLDGRARDANLHERIVTWLDARR